jgi:hypothetical protein
LLELAAGHDAKALRILGARILEVVSPETAEAICPWHHAKAHDTRYDLRKLPTGKYGFHRRT